MPSFLPRRFGKSPEPTAPQPSAHKDFRIFPEPIKESAGFRICARIEKDFDGVTRTHQLIRADTHSDQDGAIEASVAKAKQAIDQLGDGIFG